MNCPHCGSSCSVLSSSSCADCGFHMSMVEERLGYQPVVIHRLVDTQHLLRLRDSVRLETQLDEFERRFPQAFCTVFLGLLPTGVSAAEGGFWLLNHGVRTCQDQVRSNHYGIALVIDPATHDASLSLGYAVETLVSPAVAEDLLRRVKPALWHGDYATAIAKVVAGIDKILRKQGRAGRKPSLAGILKPRSLFGFERPSVAPSPTVEADV